MISEEMEVGSIPSSKRQRTNECTFCEFTSYHMEGEGGLADR